MTLKNLVMVAYGIRDFQVSGAPDWADSESYDIEAKAEGAATPREMTGLLLQSVLRERFKLSVEVSTQTLPVYLMTVSKPDVGLRRSADATCIPFDSGSPPLPGAASRKGDLCGSIGLGLTNVDAKQATMAALAVAFSHLLDRNVIDNTGLMGEFDARLQYAPMRPVPPGAPVDATLPEFFTAVREQLGLRLESGRGAVDVLVIKHVEKPSQN